MLQELQEIDLAFAFFLSRFSKILKLSMIHNHREYWLSTERVPMASVYGLEVVARFENWWKDSRTLFLDKILRMQELGLKFTCPTFGDYPPQFRCLEDFPLWLTYHGTPAWLSIGKPIISVVGSRRMTDSTKAWMESHFCDFLDRKAAVIVSGGARGVDQAAHFAALRSKCPTVVVIPSGLRNPYPEDLLDWTDAVLEKGGVFLSEYRLEQPMRKHLFPERNRLIAALGDFVLIPQAQLRSGTMLTARLAQDCGKDLAIVSAHPSDASFSAHSDLFRWGAQVVSDAADILTFYHRVMAHQHYSFQNRLAK